MNVIEVHPDHLLDRELRGALSAEEMLRLKEHLASCHACRLERQLRTDLADELPPIVGSRDVPGLVAVALQSVARQQQPAEGQEHRAGEHRLRPRHRRFQLAALLVATLALGTGLAMGQRGWTGRAWRALDDALSSAFRSRAAAPNRPRQPRATGRPSPAPSAQPAKPPPRLPRTDDSLAPSAARARTIRAPAKARMQPRRLFERANGARRRRSTAEAGILYRQLQARFPQSPEARLSLVLSARMWLDSGHNRAALSGFEAYLVTSERALREEAMAGRALALQRLGRVRASEQAFKELRCAYPRSAHAASVGQRPRQEGL